MLLDGSFFALLSENVFAIFEVFQMNERNSILVGPFSEEAGALRFHQVAWNELFFTCLSRNVSHDGVISALLDRVGCVVLDVLGLVEIVAQIRLAFLKNWVELVSSTKRCDGVAFLLSVVTEGLVNDTGHVIVTQRAVLLQINVLGLDEPIVEDNAGLVLLT